MSDTLSVDKYSGGDVDQKKNGDKLQLPQHGISKLSDAGSSESSISSLDSDLKSRENWSGRLDFLLSCIGFAVGLGNIWRFPYLCYKSGGGAFLIPYVIFLILCGLPLFFLEISYGQFASLSPITVWRMSPLFKGIGYGMVIISGLVCIYYNIIITWTFYFLFQSMQKTLPWSTCDNEWNSEYCVIDKPENSSVMVVNGTTIVLNTTEIFKTASEEFWKNNVLEETGGLENYGSIRWPLFGCLVLAWTVVFLCLCKGVKSSGKVVYVTATFPYMVLLILLIRGLTLPGALDGIKFYLIPEWRKLLEFKVWGDAAVQIFYSVGMAWGSLITMASYNKFNNNVARDALIVPLINCGTSVFAGLVIFSVLGFMAHTTGSDISKVVEQGPGLTFVAYPAAVAKMPLSQLWAILFFLMIFTIGLDSQFGMFETMTSAFIDEYPHILRKKKVLFTAAMCMGEFILGFPFIFQGGIYLLTLVDWYCSTFSLMLLSFTELVVIAYLYGIERFQKDIELMTGRRPYTYWVFMWKYVTPLIVLFVWGFSVVMLEPVSYGKYVYPGWSIVVGWLLGLCSLVPLPICAIAAYNRETSGTFIEKLRKLVQPAANWGPSQLEDKERYIASMNQFERERYEAAQVGLDRQRYLLQKNQVSPVIFKGTLTDSNMAETTQETTISMLGASNNAISTTEESSQLTNLLQGVNPPNSIV